VLTIRLSKTDRRGAFRRLGLTLAIAASPVCVYLLVNLFSNHPGLGIVSSTLEFGNRGRSVLDGVSYIWQFYLPHLPGMTNQFPWLAIPRQIWFDKSVGFYGWFDTSFPLWVDNAALVPVGLISILGARALIAGRIPLRRRFIEVVVYGAMGIGLALLVAASNYVDYTEGLSWAEPRYLLPLLPLLGAALAVAVRGAGLRWSRSVGVLIVILVLTHDVFSQLLVVSRYYS
jgi:hypothetical protein